MPCPVFFKLKENGKTPIFHILLPLFTTRNHRLSYPPSFPHAGRPPARLRGLGYIAVITEQRDRVYKICIECKKRSSKGISPRPSVTADYTLWVICLVMMGDVGWAGMLASISIWFYSRGILAGLFNPAAVTTGDAGGGMH